MNGTETEDLVAKGLKALDNGHTHLALVCFERAAEVERSPLVCSCLGYCLATARGELDRGIDLCREALGKEPGNTVHYRNLGRVLHLAGRREEAIHAFREGLRLGRDDGIIRELEALGTRKPPVLKSLDRTHFLNRWLGLMLNRLGFR